MSEEKLKEEIMKGDFIIREDDDAYVTMLAKSKKKEFYLKIGMGTFYISLLLLSLFLVQ